MFIWRLIRLLWRFRRVIMVLTALRLSDLQDSDEGSGRSHQRRAGSPKDLSKKSWREALQATKQALKDKDLATTAAALAYYATLTFFPAVLGLAGLYLLFTSPSQLLRALDGLHYVLPAAIYGLLHQSLAPLGHNPNSHALVAVILSIIALLWTTSGGLQQLIKATNKVYEVEESRKFYKLRLTSLALSGLLLVVGGLAVFLLILQGSALRHWGWPDFLATLFPILRWPLLIFLVSVVLAAIYRYAPNRPNPRWSWVSWGATAATILWLTASVLFFLYAQNFANFNKTYGTFAGIIVLMTWFNISSLIIMIGGQVNKKLEVVSDD